MNLMVRVALSCFCLYACSGGVRAADVSKLSEVDRKQVNEWMAQRAETVIDAHRIEREVQQAWADTKYTSPEVDLLRARYRELQQALIKTQEELQKKVLEVPAVQAQVRKLEETREKERALSKKIAEKTGE